MKEISVCKEKVLYIFSTRHELSDYQNITAQNVEM